jgi:NAD(P)H-quinone oxidoreductase subunit 5
MSTTVSLLLSVPLLFGIAGLCLMLPTTGVLAHFTLSRRWLVAQLAAHTAPLLTALAVGAYAVGSGAHVAHVALPGAGLLAQVFGGAPATLSVRGDALSLIMLALVTFVALVITRFSQRYLAGEPGQLRYLRALLLIVTAVSLLVIANHLLLLAAAWSVSSIALHQLLTFYPDRPQALVAAHKKFLMSRVADAALFAALLLLHRGFGTLELDALAAHAQQGVPESLSIEAAGALLAFGVMLRSAQLPFHGWLIQVMETPTPVSALLHAGIVNIGGFVLIRLSGLLPHLEVAQTLLVLGGALTATVAALVMTTRVSVKVGLAWSTSAQMGFMLVECALGAFELALLHLVAHSLYKAHAFLASGRVVQASVAARLRHARRCHQPGARVGGSRPHAALGVRRRRARWEVASARATAGWAAGFIAALALTPLLARVELRRGLRTNAALVGAAAAALLLYLGLHAGFGLALPASAPRAVDAGSLLRLGLVAGLFAAAFGLHTWLVAAPAGRLSRRLFPMVFAGFYLDEIFTRLTFVIWPPRPLESANHPSTLSGTTIVRSAA